MKGDDLQNLPPEMVRPIAADDEGVGVTEVITWVGEGKRLIAAATLIAGVLAVAVGLLLPKTYTAHATFLAPGSQQQSGSAAALAALGSLGGLIGAGGAKSPDELYVALLKSESVERALAERFALKTRYDAPNSVALLKEMQKYIRVGSDKKSGLITVEVDDEDPQFAANLANAHASEVAKVLGRLAISEAQSRRMFFEKQLGETKESLIKAEQALREVQERSGVIVLDKQAEALITAAAQLRAQIAEREIQLKVLRTTSTERNPDVVRLTSELRAMQSELARMDSSDTGSSSSAVDMPVGKLPAAGVDYVRARRELKLQETLLEAMLRQYESAKLDEAKEGPALQQVDLAVAPDHKSKPVVALIVLACAALAMFGATAAVVLRRYVEWSRERFPEEAQARAAMWRAWRWRH